VTLRHPVLLQSLTDTRMYVEAFSFPAKEPYNYWLFCGKRATKYRALLRKMKMPPHTCTCTEKIHRWTCSYYVFILYVHIILHISNLYIIIRYHTKGWRRLIGSPKLQIIFHKRATKYWSLVRKMTYKDKGSYESSPPCTLANACRLMKCIHTFSETLYTHTWMCTIRGVCRVWE